MFKSWSCDCFASRIELLELDLPPYIRLCWLLLRDSEGDGLDCKDSCGLCFCQWDDQLGEQEQRLYLYNLLRSHLWFSGSTWKRLESRSAEEVSISGVSLALHDLILRTMPSSYWCAHGGLLLSCVLMIFWERSEARGLFVYPIWPKILVPTYCTQVSFIFPEFIFSKYSFMRNNFLIHGLDENNELFSLVMIWIFYLFFFLKIKKKIEAFNTLEYFSYVRKTNYILAIQIVTFVLTFFNILIFFKLMKNSQMVPTNWDGASISVACSWIWICAWVSYEDQSQKLAHISSLLMLKRIGLQGWRRMS